MSLVYKKRWELIFLVKHCKGPKMSIESAAKYLQQSRGWATGILAKFEETGNVDFCDEKGPKRPQKSKIVRSSHLPRLQSR